MPKKQRIIIIAGPNGAGKTTFAREYLLKEAHCPEFIESARQKKKQKKEEQKKAPELTATVTETPVAFSLNMPLNTANPEAGPFFTGFGSILTITLLEDGKPVEGATGTESVTGSKGEKIEQNPRPVTTDANGQSFDLVSRGAFTPQRVDRATALRTFNENSQNPVDVTTLQTITLKLPRGGTVQIIFERRLTNLDQNGKIRPPGPPRTGPAQNYTITVSPASVKRVK